MPIEYGRGVRHTIRQIRCHRHQIVVAQLREVLGTTTGVVHLFHEGTHLGRLGLLLQHVANALTDALAGPAQVNF